MISIDRVHELLNEIAEEIPAEFFKGLNGGVILSQEVKIHPESIGNDLYILGQYQSDHFLGKTIVIYYGSFMRVFGYMDEVSLRKELRQTLLHEFTHHLEGLSGIKGLERKDRRDIDAYIKSKQKK